MSGFTDLQYFRGGGNNLSPMEYEARACHRERFYGEGEFHLKIGHNFLHLRIFLTKIVESNLPPELNPTLRNSWRICQANACHITHS
jgi:hypothetical protein